jgi:cytosine/adenosine deaminase-related metal-dependent hydrolase
LNGALSYGIPIALGSDSAVTANGDLLDELRVARGYLPAPRLYRMVTEEPARILRLPRGFGAIVPGGPADLIAISGDGREPAAALLRAKRPDWVFVAGKLKLSSRPNARLHRLSLEGRGEVYKVESNGTDPVFCQRNQDR